MLLSSRRCTTGALSSKVLFSVNWNLLHITHLTEKEQHKKVFSQHVATVLCPRASAHLRKAEQLQKKGWNTTTAPLSSSHPHFILLSCFHLFFSSCPLQMLLHKYHVSLQVGNLKCRVHALPFSFKQTNDDGESKQRWVPYYCFLFSTEGLNMKLTFVSAAYEPQLHKHRGNTDGGKTHTQWLIFALSTQRGAKHKC